VSVINAAGGTGCDIGGFEMQLPSKGGPRR
jgi:hypothetical protein